MSALKRNSITLAVLFVVVAIVGYVTYTIAIKNKQTEEGSAAASALQASEVAPYTDLQGKSFTFEQFSGKVRVVNSWASWCPFCAQELAEFEKLAQEFSTQEVAVIAVNRMETKDKAEKYLQSIGTFEALYVAVDLTDAFYKSIGGFTMPETVFYSAQGDVVVHKRGFMNLDEMRKHTLKAIEISR